MRSSRNWTGQGEDVTRQSPNSFGDCFTTRCIRGGSITRFSPAQTFKLPARSTGACRRSNCFFVCKVQFNASASSNNYDHCGRCRTTSFISCRRWIRWHNSFKNCFYFCNTIGPLILIKETNKIGDLISLSNPFQVN